MKTLKYLIICFVVCCLFTSNVFADSHGISLTKDADSPTQVGSLYTASYTIENDKDTGGADNPDNGGIIGDTLEVYGVTDIVQAAGGDQSSGNIIAVLNWTVTGAGSYYDNVNDKLVLAPGGVAVSDPYGFYVVTSADFNLPNHVLPDQVTIDWTDTCDNSDYEGNNCFTRDETATASSATQVTAPGAGLTVTKDVDCDIATIGKELTYTITVENTGDTVLNWQSSTDSILDDTELANALVAAGADILDVGEKQSVILNYTVLGSDPDPLVNTVEIAYIDQYQQIASDTGSVSVNIIAPDFTVTKQCTSQPIPEGGPATFDVVISNIGDVDLEFTTDEAGLSDTLEPFTVSAKGSITLGITILADGSSNVDNEITVTGSVGDDCIDDITKTSNLATCYAEPTIDVTKEAECDIAEVGTVITYTITVENLSPNVLTLVGVSDTLLDDADVLAAILGGPCEVLDPGETCSFTVDREILETDSAVLNNMITLTYEDDWQVQASDSDSAAVAVIDPDMTVTKTCLVDPIPSGGPATFEVVVTNTGDVDLSCTTNEAALSSVAEPFLVTANGGSRSLTITVDADGSQDVFNAITVKGEPNGIEIDPDCPVAPVIKTASNKCKGTPGLEGCTPGFWKNHPLCWLDNNCELSPDLELGAVFNFVDAREDVETLGERTLMDALSFKGGKTDRAKIRILLKHAVSALLNACDPDVDYPVSYDYIKDEVDKYLADPSKTSPSWATLKIELDDYNNLGCPIDAHCDPIPDEPDGLIVY